MTNLNINFFYHGSGFYLGPDYGNAKRWALRRNYEGYVYYYLISIEVYKQFNVYRFKNASTNWIDFLIANRMPNTGMQHEKYYEKVRELYSQYDIIIGDIADNKVKDVVDAFVFASMEYSSEELLRQKQMLISKLRPGMISGGRMKYQVCVKNNRCLNYFERVLAVKVDKMDREHIVRKGC